MLSRKGLTPEAMGEALEAGRATVHCPKCDSTDIREINEATILAPVVAWCMDSDGTLRPADVDCSDSADWETTSNGPSLTCGPGGCDWCGEAEELVLRALDREG